MIKSHTPQHFMNTHFNFRGSLRMQPINYIIPEKLFLNLRTCIFVKNILRYTFIFIRMLISILYQNIFLEILILMWDILFTPNGRVTGICQNECRYLSKCNARPNRKRHLDRASSRSSLDMTARNLFILFINVYICKKSHTDNEKSKRRDDTKDQQK